jgi:transcriptional antiterminator Rof (Rho-off)
MQAPAIGTCSLVDVFEEAATLRRPVVVRMRGGEEVVAHVDDVVTESGVDYVVIRGRGRVAVGDIASARRG